MNPAAQTTPNTPVNTTNSHSQGMQNDNNFPIVNADSNTNAIQIGMTGAIPQNPFQKAQDNPLSDDSTSDVSTLEKYLMPNTPASNGLQTDSERVDIQKTPASPVLNIESKADEALDSLGIAQDQRNAFLEAPISESKVSVNPNHSTSAKSHSVNVDQKSRQTIGSLSEILSVFLKADSGIDDMSQAEAFAHTLADKNWNILQNEMFGLRANVDWDAESALLEDKSQRFIDTVKSLKAAREVVQHLDAAVEVFYGPVSGEVTGKADFRLSPEQLPGSDVNSMTRERRMTQYTEKFPERLAKLSDCVSALCDLSGIDPKIVTPQVQEALLRAYDLRQARVRIFTIASVAVMNS